MSVHTHAPEWVNPSGKDGQSQSWRIKTITPLFGGGFEAGIADQEYPIRSAAIRGHLRFWWRALVGGQYSSPKELFEAETAIFGSASTPGKLRIQVDMIKNGIPKKCANYEQRNDGNFKTFPKFEPGWPSYALQAFQGKANGSKVETEPSIALLDSVFMLTLNMKDMLLPEVIIQAVTAWVDFGGLGARSRRGCGSLAFEENSQNSFPIISESVHESMLTLLPGSQMAWGSKTNNAINAWRMAVDVYKNFRQKEGFARNQGHENGRPGRSRWPEPDSIRRMSHQNSSQHKPTHVIEVGFPRADLGLPIIFHFKDVSQGDPEDHTLNGPEKGYERFASPVITRAVAVEGGYRPLLLVLNAPHVWAKGILRLCSSNGEKPVSQRDVELTEDQRKKIQDFAYPSVREALIKYAKSQQGWSEGGKL
jgi:CRISPR-associated protein Cmr1